MQDVRPPNHHWIPDQDFAPPNQDADQGVSLGYQTLPFSGEPFCARDGRAISVMFAHDSRHGNVDMGTSLTLGFVPGPNGAETNAGFHASQRAGHPLRVFKSFKGRIMYRGVYVIRRVDRRVEKWYLAKLSDRWQSAYPNVQTWIEANLEHERARPRPRERPSTRKRPVGRGACRSAAKRFFGQLGAV